MCRQMVDKPTLMKFPAPDRRGVDEALRKALDDKLTNVIILSERESGAIYHVTSDDLTLAQANWIIDSYKRWIMQQADKDRT